MEAHSKNPMKVSSELLEMGGIRCILAAITILVVVAMLQTCIIVLLRLCTCIGYWCNEKCYGNSVEIRAAASKKCNSDKKCGGRAATSALGRPPCS